MPIDKIIVILFSTAGIIFTYWFFLLKSSKEFIVQNNSVDIIVEGGYQPELITLQKGKTTTINFLRKDPSACLEEIVLPDFRIRKTLPLNKVVSINITPEQTGEFDIHCGMNMFHGKVRVFNGRS